MVHTFEKMDTINPTFEVTVVRYLTQDDLLLVNTVYQCMFISRLTG